MPNKKHTRTRRKVSAVRRATPAKSVFLEDTLAIFFEKKVPSLPMGAKDVIVKLAPWLVLLLTVLLLPAFLGVVGLSTALTPMYYYGWGAQRGGFLLLQGLFTVALIILYVLALPGLYKRARSGWQYMYYAALLGVVRNLVTFDVSGLVIGSVISLYVLFQVRAMYRK